MRISVIIVAYQGDKWLPKCIESINASSHHRIELLLVDNYDSPCLAGLKTPGLTRRIVKTPRVMGFAEANNFALTNGGCDSDAVLLLNQDTWSESQWIPQCADILESDQSVNAVSPIIKQYDNDQLDPNFETSVADAGFMPQGATPVTVEHVPAVALMIRTETLKAVGPLDPIFGSYYEDYDLCLRLNRHEGRIVIATDASVRHFSGSASTTDASRRKRSVQIIRNRLIYKLRKEGGPRWMRLLGHFGRDLPRNLLRGLLRTQSSQPISVTIEGNLEILKLLRRISSKKQDELGWRQYLDQIAWH